MPNAQISRNQIWSLERVDVLSSTDSSLPPYAPTTPTVRYAEIVEGDHALRNIGTGHYITFTGIPHYCIVPASSKSSELRFGQAGIRVTYADNSSNTFRLSFSGSTNLAVRISGNATEVAFDLDMGTLWVLEVATDFRASGGFASYYICSALDRSQVLSGETTADARGVQVFKVTTKVPGVTIQQWKFESRY
ncbi:hypothetical protein H0H92_014605 [Tricholoma furcatifolium]|nr:hypothetical protein H0H92_014605 [Tricholoma furcatifolium]